MSSLENSVYPDQIVFHPHNHTINPYYYDIAPFAGNQILNSMCMYLFTIIVKYINILFLSVGGISNLLDNEGVL